MVHGRNAHAREDVAHLLERVCPTADVEILGEQPGAARSLIEKYEAVARRSMVAVVLMTADDVGGLAGGKLRPRARQNVVFELGYFVASIGRRRIVVLCEASLDVDLPSDIKGMHWLPFDDDGAWRVALARELQAMGIDVDSDGLLD